MNMVYFDVNVLSYLLLFIAKLLLLLLLFEFVMVEILPWTNWLVSAESRGVFYCVRQRFEGF